MTTTVEKLENTIRALVETITERNTYVLEEMGPVPTNPYCTIHLQPARQLDHDVKEYDHDNDVQTIRGLTHIRCTIAAWGGSSTENMTKMKRMQASLQADARIFDLYAIAGKGEVTEIVQLPDEYEGERRQRAQFDLGLYTTLPEEFAVECFDKVDITCESTSETVTIGTDTPPPSQDTSGCP